MWPFVLLCSLAAQTAKIHGAVRDSSGAAVGGAEITFLAGSFRTSARSDSDGAFELPGASDSGTLSVFAPGFATVRLSWDGHSPIEIVLHPSGANEQIVVSATRVETRLADTPGSLVLLSSDDVASTPALTTDDLLRQVPGFSLFRRSGSRVANPTSQGVSLRGLGASGPSRALVLEDGIPLVDPFGGWVYWGRVPRAELSSIEVVRGGASSLYGNDALGGVVQFISREPSAPAISLDTSYGNQATPDLSVWSGTKVGSWELGGAADLFHTDGYRIVPDSIRGAIDTPANSEHASVDLSVRRDLGSSGRIFFRPGFFTEARNNGTVQQVNDTHVGTLATGVDERFGSHDSLSARIYGEIQSYNQSFTSIAANRNSETLVDLQAVPSQQLGANVQWTHVVGKHTIIGGAEVSEVIGESDEQLFAASRNSVAGGRQRTVGIFGEDVFHLKKWTFVIGARFDHWGNFNGRSLSTPFPGSPTTATLFPARDQNAFNPRLSLIRSLGNHVSVTASGYRAFRAPTLNELYRSFRLGNVLTQSNPGLVAERLTGGETGVNLNSLDRRLTMRGTFFWSDIVNPVANVTLSNTPSLITRQRQNLGRTRSKGLELEGTAHISTNIDISAGYTLTDATVVRFPANTSIEGLWVPQIPRHQFTVEGRYWNRKGWMLSAIGRYVGVQFDDDQNQLPLDRFFALDISGGRSLGRGIEIYAAAENLTNQRYQVARTPTPNLGPPILFRLGMRLNLPAERGK